LRCGMQCLAVSMLPRGPISNMRLKRFVLNSAVGCGKIAEAQLT
jgi:hypothetical protein